MSPTNAPLAGRSAKAPVCPSGNNYKSHFKCQQRFPNKCMNIRPIRIALKTAGAFLSPTCFLLLTSDTPPYFSPPKALEQSKCPTPGHTFVSLGMISFYSTVSFCVEGCIQPSVDAAMSPFILWRVYTDTATLMLRVSWTTLTFSPTSTTQLSKSSAIGSAAQFATNSGAFSSATHFLPHNNPLNVQGDLVIMRVDDNNISSVVDMVPAESVVADFVAQHFAILLRHFQGPRRTLICGIQLEMP
ncbi:hypothetical protein B0H13DRAFT_1906856 [Mycena leptocephala]|nr:hypothetical protein B0H13DRAFT_1906856 [Mycena leptocephala]